MPFLSFRVRQDIPYSPFFAYIDMSEYLPDEYEPNKKAAPGDTEGTLYHDMVEGKFGAPIRFHNWTCKLISRLYKYKSRGIEVVDPPTTRADIDHLPILPYDF
jgi:hypothetical protein